ncbi:protein tyrosine phosphatase type IVA 1 [Trichonephila clavipes]|uniref:Protein tyrosine phosphatase type IVA 1 n=1 Tax=Trichonephila clavipes TaxID=2585209 RepID=A0A8X6S4S1_TRICX|nr:protein tyrosine phosphatase type IVA 1 [Trichonephila clavipes]
MSSPWCDMVVRRKGASSGVILVTLPWFKMTRSIAKSSCAVEQCNVNIHSLTGPQTSPLYFFCRSYPLDGVSGCLQRKHRFSHPLFGFPKLTCEGMTMKQKLMRPGPSEIVYKNMRFLIMDRPTDATIAAFIEELKKKNVTEVVRVCEPTYKTDVLEKHASKSWIGNLMMVLPTHQDSK